MRANCWQGKHRMSVEHVPDPKILNSRDAIVKITSTAICGSDLHLYNGFVPTMEQGDIVGHEFMGEVMEVGRGRQEPQTGRSRGGAVPDRVRPMLLLPARAVLAVRELQPQRLDGGEALGPLAGGAVRLLAPARRIRGRPGRVCACAVRRCRADQNRNGFTDEQVLFLSDIFPPATWPPKPATSSRETPSRSGDAGPWDSSPSRARSCWARSV